MGWRSRTNTKAETEIEEYLHEKTKASGGKCPKWTSPGTRGVPDRIVLMPRVMCFVETKREVGGKKSGSQKYWVRELNKLGHRAYFINTKDQVDNLIKHMEKGQLPDEL